MIDNKEFIIIPGCCDLNRGDQALGWETREIAKDAGFVGHFSIMAEKTEPTKQSEEQGFGIIVPVLQHPTRILKNRDNIHYGFWLKMRLGFVAFFDFIYSYLLITPIIKYLIRLLTFNRDRKKCLKLMKECKAVFMKGGGLIQSHGGFTSTYATYYRLYSVLLAHSYNKPVYIMPNSFGPFEGPFVKRMVKRAFKKCKLVTCRENVSSSYVMDKIKIHLDTYPDLAFFLKNGNISKEAFASKHNLPLNKKWVALTARPYRFPNCDNPNLKYSNYIESMCRLIEWLRSSGFAVLLIEHTFATTSHENDRNALQAILDKLEDQKDCYFVSDPDLNCYELKKVYSFCAFIVGTRFHSLIFSLSNLVPGIAISYDGNKTTGIMCDMGLDKYVVDIYNITGDILIELMSDVISNEEIIKSKIKNYLFCSSKKRKDLVLRVSSLI